MSSSPPTCCHASPSQWVWRFGRLIPRGAPVLDLACGGGRHIVQLRHWGYSVVGVDRDLTQAREVIPLAAGDESLRWIEADLESQNPFAPGGILHGARFSGIVVVNYLHRPLLSGLIDSLLPGGVLIYETFAEGNARFGRPDNPAYLLKVGELLTLAAGRMQIVSYAHARVDRQAGLAVKQFLCARKNREEGH